MTQADNPSIFISYARKDGMQLARRLQGDLSANGFDVWLDTDRIRGGATWTVEIERALDRCHVILALLTTGSYVSDLCRAEQLYALRKGKYVIPLVGESRTEIPVHLETKNYRDFSGAKPYEAQLRLLIEDIGSRDNAVGLRPEFRVTYVTAPPLPRNYIERSDALVTLRKALISDDPGPSIALTALKGMGGIGKTILAQALAGDEIVQQAFPDGVIWTTAGKERTHNLSTRMSEVRRALGETPGDSESELECINRYRTLMQHKAALIIVDDVWRAEDVEPFRAVSSRSRLLFTTRDGSIAATIGAEEYVADLLTMEQSRDLLARWSGLKPVELPPEAEAILRECGLLPLALSMMGAILRDKPRAYWRHLVHLLQTADLAKIRAQFPDYPHADLLRSIQVSVDALDGTSQSRYLALAVLGEDTPVHPAIQQTLWNVNEQEALATAEQFVSLSLAQREDQSGSIRLHDLQLDYVRAQYRDPAALDLIHGAVRLSSHVIGKDPTQFASQVVGRLLAHQAVPTVKQFINSVITGAPRPWLRPLFPALYPPGSALMRTLDGDFSHVTMLAVSPDGLRLVSPDTDKTLNVWNLETGRVLRRLEASSGYVVGLAISSDGRRAISASPGKVKVWDLETGREIRTLESQFDSFARVLLHPNGQRAFSVSWDKLRLWDLETGRELRTLDGHFDLPFIDRVAVSLDGRRAVSASRDNTLTVWDLETGRELPMPGGPHGYVDAVAVSPDGRWALSALDDNSVKVWDLETGRELQTLKGHRGRVRAVSISSDGRRALSASDDNSLKVWDLETGRELQTLKAHTDSVTSVAVSLDGRRAVSVSRDKTLKVWNLEMGHEQGTPKGHSDAVAGIAVTADGRLALSASPDGTMKLWDMATGRELRTVKGSFLIRGVALCAGGGRAVSASLDNTVRVWDLETGRTLRILQGHSKPVSAVALTLDGRRVVSASEDSTLKVWDLETGCELRTIEGHSASVNGVAVSGDGRRAASASSDMTLRVWDLETGHELQRLEGHSSFVNGVAIGPDGRLAISVSEDTRLKVWDLETGRELRTFEGHSPLIGVALSSDGRLAVSVSRDNTLKVWEQETGTLLATFTCDAAVRCCAFGQNCKLVAGDGAGRIHFLSLELEESTAPPSDSIDREARPARPNRSAI